MEMKFEIDLNPADILCGLLNIPVNVQNHDLDESRDSLVGFRSELEAFMNKYGFLIRIDGEPGFEKYYDFKENEDYYYWRDLVEAYTTQQKAKEILSLISEKNPSFFSNEYYKNFFDLHFSYDPAKNMLVIPPGKISLQNVLGLAFIDLYNSKYSVRQCPNCKKWYPVKGLYNPSGCEDCRSAIINNKYKQSVQADPIKKTYNTYYQRYYKRKSLSSSSHTAWAKKAAHIRDEYSARWQVTHDDSLIDEFKSRIDIDLG